MTRETAQQNPAGASTDLLDEIRDSAKTGQHTAADALRTFYRTIDEALPEAVQPLRKQIVDAAIELADKLVAAQYQFNRNLVRTADRALRKSDGAAHATVYRIRLRERSGRFERHAATSDRSTNPATGRAPSPV